MIYDCFPFFNELDVLDIRLEELYPVVDFFVIVESNLTFMGNQKPSYFLDNVGRYEKYLDKIIHINYIDNNVYTRSGIEMWEREEYQRNQIMRGLVGCKPDDVILISDADEIPRREIIAALNPKPIQSLALKVFLYSINIFDDCLWTSKVVRYDAITTPEKIRKIPPLNVVDDAGWHFSYLGTPEHIALKFHSFSHSEVDIPEINNAERIRLRIENHQCLWTYDDKQYAAVEVDETWPEAIKRNREYWNKYMK